MQYIWLYSWAIPFSMSAAVVVMTTITHVGNYFALYKLLADLLQTLSIRGMQL